MSAVDDGAFAFAKIAPAVIVDNFANTWAQFGLDRAPFDDSHSVYYPVASWDEHLRYLQRFPAGPYPLLLIPGIVGCGKTTLLQRFVSQQDQPARIHYLRAEPQHSLNQLIYALYHNTGMTPRAAITLPDLLSQLSDLAEAVGTQMLIIDNAHRLSRETLIRLLHLLFEQDVAHSKLHVVLCGEPVLQEKVIGLLGEFAPGRQVPCLELESLSLAQTREYLEYRLAQAGLTGKLPFNNTMLKQVHVLSGGFPGRINRVAQQVLLDAAKLQPLAKGKFTMMNEFVMGHKIKLMGIILLVATGVLLWQLQPLLQASTQQNKPQVAEAVMPALKQLPRPHYAAIDDVHQIPEEAVVMSSAKGEDLSVRDAILTAMGRLDAQEMKDAEASYHTLALQQAPHFSQDNGPQFAKADAKVIAQSAAITKSVAKFTRNEQEILARRGYTVQLMGARDAEGLEEFIDRHELKNAAYYRTQLKGKDWYVLVYGQFNSAGAAMAAINKLPQEVRDKQPWVRPLTSVHAAIQAKTHLAENDEDDNSRG